MGASRAVGGGARGLLRTQLGPLPVPARPQNELSQEVLTGDSPTMPKSKASQPKAQVQRPDKVLQSDILRLSLSIWLCLFVEEPQNCGFPFGVSFTPTKGGTLTKRHTHMVVSRGFPLKPLQPQVHLAMGQKPVPPVNIPIPTKIEKWVVHLPQTGTFGFDPQPLQPHRDPPRWHAAPEAGGKKAGPRPRAWTPNECNISAGLGFLCRLPFFGGVQGNTTY